MADHGNLEDAVARLLPSRRRPDRLIDHSRFFAEWTWQFLDPQRLKDNQSVGQLQRFEGFRIGVNVAVQIGSRQRDDERSVGKLLPKPDDGVMTLGGMQ